MRWLLWLWQSGCFTLCQGSNFPPCSGFHQIRLLPEVLLKDYTTLLLLISKEVFFGNYLEEETKESNKYLVLCFPEVKSESEVTQSCPTLCHPMDYSLPSSSIYGIFQARILEWAATAFSRGSSRPRDRTQVSHIVGRGFTIWATTEVQKFDKFIALTYYFLAVLGLCCHVSSSMAAVSQSTV